MKTPKGHFEINWPLKRKKPPRDFYGKCDLCQKEYTQQRNFQRHISKCDGNGVNNYIQSIKCSKCGETFSAENIYIKHYQSKHGGIPLEYIDREKFFCEQCPGIFLEQYKLTSHKTNVHGVKNEFWRASHLFFPNFAYFPHIRNRNSTMS